MSRRRPSKRDRLEADLLALAASRDDLVSGAALARLDKAMLEVQAQLERVESPRLPEGAIEMGVRRDALEMVPAGQMMALEVPGAEEGERLGELAADEESAAGARAKALRMLALTVGILRRVVQAKSKPRLEAYAGLFALNVDCESMRKVAEAEGVSIEWVSQKAEQVRLLFNLPKNQHNKSDRAVESYRAVANLKGKKP